LRVYKRADMNNGLYVVALVIVFTLLVIAHGGLSAEKPPRESEACVDCHDDKLQTLHNTPHQILADKAADMSAVACTDCHPGDANHYEDDPEKYLMTNPAKTDFNQAAQICASCHDNSHQQNMEERNPHPENGVGCTDCHQIHGVERAGLLKNKEVKLCYGCHTSVRGEFAQPYRHPVWDEVVRCSDCHMSLAEDKHLLSHARMDQACFQCHQYYQGPFPYENQATIGWPSSGSSAAAAR